MIDFFSTHFVRLWEALWILISVLVVFTTLFASILYKYRQEKNRYLIILADFEQQYKTLKRENAALQEQVDPDRLRQSIHHLMHEFVKGLDAISIKSRETLHELRAEQVGLKEKQTFILNKSQELIQHGDNISGLTLSHLPPSSQQLVNLRSLIEGVLVELVPFAEAKGVNLFPELSDISPVLVHRDSLKHIISNLAHNAIKYSFNGGAISVTLSVHTKSERHKVIHIDVKDQGKGIKDDQKERIFQLYVREDGLPVPGSGIGLPYAQKLARLHKGDVVLVESKPNEGSTFRLWLPYPENQQKLA